MLQCKLNEAEAAELQQQFFKEVGFPSVVGVVNYTHIRIQGPSDHEEAYVSCHSYHTINVQLVVDAAYQIRHVIARWPGSANDSHIFKKSALPGKLSNGKYDDLLLGDSKYACKPWHPSCCSCHRQRRSTTKRTSQPGVSWKGKQIH
ncbi:hypothetical protein HPB47_024463 [Ixodes persulcatus]|uniref:Uncharacterized protein n=1 Tax=Ixodes persulcatus TaxID=34615 RepID=A0AC60Q6J6_IXOPE|nr:hypothetical protein HPB47_024463 [Ixodes persulcatus]